MAFNTNEVSLDKLVDRFEKATAILKRQMTMQEIATHVHISPGFLSRYRKPQLYNLPPSAYHSLFETIDQLILNKFKQKWDKNLDEYELVSGANESDTSEVLFNNKLSGFQGNWQGFSWNREKTEFSSKFENDTPAQYFNMFTLTISESGQVVCMLEKNEMSGTIRFVSPKTITIELQSLYRKLVMFATISLRDDLELVEDVTLAYVDTGDKFVKCGLAIINKIDNGLKLPVAKSFRQENVDGISPFEQEYLLGTQHTAVEWNFMV